MAFDKNNDLDLAALQSEQLNDPVGMGYAAVNGNTQATLDLFNVTSNNVGGEIGTAKLLAGDLLNIIFNEPISSQDQFNIGSLFNVANDVGADLSDFRLQVANLSNGLNTTITAHTRALSRAEALFSNIDSNGVTEYVVISKADWIAARDYVGV